MRDSPPLPVPEQPPAQPVKPNPLKKTKPKALVLKVAKMRALAMQRPRVSARASRFHIGALIHPESARRPYAPDGSKPFPPRHAH